jgi:hypothetical protein
VLFAIIESKRANTEQVLTAFLAVIRQFETVGHGGFPSEYDDFLLEKTLCRMTCADISRACGRATPSGLTAICERSRAVGFLHFFTP